MTHLHVDTTTRRCYCPPMRNIVGMDAHGRITLPAAVRKKLGITGESQFEVEVASGAIVLKPVVVLPQEDTWAYTPEHRRLLERAHEDSRAGRVRTLTERELE